MALTCKCGEYAFATKDIRPPFTRAPKNFYGGHVTRFSEASCPTCGVAHTLWLRPTGQSWRVVEAKLKESEPESLNAADPYRYKFEGMERSEVIAWLEERGIEFAPTVGTDRLKGKARAWLAEHEMGAGGE